MPLITRTLGWEDGMAFTEEQLTQLRAVVIAGSCAAFRMPEPDNPQKLPAGMAVAQGQLHNGLFFKNQAGAAGQQFNSVGALTTAVTAIRAQVGAQADDQAVILAALTALHITLSDAQIADLAARLPGVDYDRITAAVRFKLAVIPDPGE